MNLSAIATLILATFTAAAPLNCLFESNQVSFEHVPDENKRQEIENVISIMADSLHDAFPDQIEDDKAYDKVMTDVQNMIATVLNDSHEILSASGLTLESLMSENDFLNAFSQSVEEKRMIPVVVKKIVIKLLKAMLKNLFKSILDISKDAGVEIEKLWADIETMNIN